MAKTLALNTKDEFVLAVNNEWRAALSSIIEVGRILRQAADTLGRKEFHTMATSELPFTLRTAEKLMTVAADKRITNPKYAEVLPPYWTTLNAKTIRTLGLTRTCVTRESS